MKLGVDGEGSFVKAIASLDGPKISLVVVNYDVNSKNTENVPVLFTNLANGSYELTIRDLNDSKQSQTIEVTSNTYSHTLLMAPNAVFGIELKKN